MSLWDKWLAPGDLRQRQLQEEQRQRSSTPAEAASAAAQEAPPDRLTYAHRQRRKNGVFVGGLAFTFASLFITRRALRRRQLSTWPRMFTPSNATVAKADGPTDAVEALFLATLNVCSMFMTAIGVGMVQFDVAEVEDLREMQRANLGYDVRGGDREADQEIEARIREFLDSRKEGESAEGTAGSFLQGSIMAQLGKIAEFASEEERLKREREQKKS